MLNMDKVLVDYVLFGLTKILHSQTLIQQHLIEACVLEVLARSVGQVNISKNPTELS